MEGALGAAWAQRWAMSRRGRALFQSMILAGIALLIPAGGCAHKPRMLDPQERHTIDRNKVEHPAGFDLEPYLANLTAPSAMTFDSDGNILIAESGRGGTDVHIYGFKPSNGTRFDIYPLGRRFPFVLGPEPFSLYGPIGGMLWYNGKLYVSHRDANDFGVITALDYTGGHQTVVAGLPAQGEYSVVGPVMDFDTDGKPRTGRLYFGVGTATNSGVVGQDDIEMGWFKDHPTVHDLPWHDLRLRGLKYISPNPGAGLFGPGDTSVVGPFQSFGMSNRTTIPGVSPQSPKFNGGIFSILPGGGELRGEAHGIHCPRGMAFAEYGRLSFTNDGMELRGSRPIKDDHDSVVNFVPGYFYGWPDYTTDFQSVADVEHQPPRRLIFNQYESNTPVIDLENSSGSLRKPNAADVLVAAFPSQSGAAGMTFIPPKAPFRDYIGDAVVALFGDHAPFSTSGEKNFLGSPGYKVMRVDANNTVHEFIRNVQGKPTSMIHDDPDQLERPIDVKFGPDGSMYILDFGQMIMKGGQEVVTPATGKVFRLVPRHVPTTDRTVSVAGQ